jgi:hypothetical protein
VTCAHACEVRACVCVSVCASALRATSALFDIGAVTLAPRDLVLLLRIERIACADEVCRERVFVCVCVT